MLRRSIAAGFAFAAAVGAGPLHAQLPRPLIPLQGTGNRVAPFFDGWYENDDGSISFSFGYSNLNKETVEIPLGPDNFITPKEYDGRQPTTFLVMGPDPPTAAAAVAAAPSRPSRRPRPRAGPRVPAPAWKDASAIASAACSP